MLAEALSGGGQTQDLVVGIAVFGLYIGYLRHTGCERTGFVQNDGGDAAGRLQCRSALEQHAQLRGAPGGHHDGGWRRKPQSARTRDDEHAHKVQQRLLDGSGEEPDHQRCQRGEDNGGREPTGHHVG